MKIITVTRILDDNGKECQAGDQVLLQTKEMDDIVQATIDNIMTNMASFIIDDRSIGYVPIKVRASDIMSLTLYQKKRNP